jgi:MFS family permease
MMFAVGTWSFYALRIALGLAEAGFFPGAVLYLTYWFPQRERGRLGALFMAAGPVALIHIGNAISHVNILVGGVSVFARDVTAALNVAPGARAQVLHREEDPFTIFPLPRPHLVDAERQHDPVPSARAGVG